MAEEKELKREMNYPLILWYIHLHALGLYGLYLLFFEAKWITVVYAFLLISIACFSVAAGAHRLWAHQAYNASWTLRLFLILAHFQVGVGSVYEWALAHRIHHKFYGTDKDPYNHNKGFIYSHFFSNMLTSHPEQEKLEKAVDMRDIDADGFVWIQRRLYWILMPIIGLLLPINAPAEYWDESIWNSVFIIGFLRLAITVNYSWLVNSGLLIWGLEPGEKYPPDGNSVFLVNKSYWPHYHYKLPWDWKTGEFGTYNRGCTTSIIKILTAVGMISDLKTATDESVRDAMGEAVISGKPLEECLLKVQKQAEEDILKEKLLFQH